MNKDLPPCAHAFRLSPARPLTNTLLNTFAKITAQIVTNKDRFIV